MRSRVADLECLQALGKLAQGPGSAQPFGGIASAGGLGEQYFVPQNVNIG